MTATGPALPLYPYQRRWVRDDSRFKIGMFARQTGKTFTTTLEIVDTCFAATVNGRRRRWVILSRGERQAREAMEEGVKRHAQAYRLGFESHEYDFKGDNGSVRALEVDLPGGSRITALPANPDTARGFSAEVYRLVQTMLDGGRLLRDPSGALIVQSQHLGDWWQAVLKFARGGREIYLATLHRSTVRKIAKVRRRRAIIREGG